MTPKKNEKSLHQTARQLAMATSEAREALMFLRVHWDKLSPLQRGKQLDVLIGFKCSVRGIAAELQKPATSIRRYIALANPAKAGSNWIEEMQRTWAEEPEDQSEMNVGEDARQIPSGIPTETTVRSVTKEVLPAQNHALTSTAQQTKKTSSPLSTKVKQPPVVNGATSGQENRAGEDTRITRLVDAYMNRGQVIDDNMQRLARLSEEIVKRPLTSARLMKRQGRALPPTDTH